MSSPEHSADEKLEMEDEAISIISVRDAAKASIVQSIAFAAQNEVDAWRNQNTVDLVAMGTAYAKWLENPVMAEQFEKIVNQSRRSDVLTSTTLQTERLKSGPSELKSERLSTSIFKTFLGDLPK